MTAPDPLLDRIRALSALPGRWTAVAAPLSGCLMSVGIIEAVMIDTAWLWLVAVGFALAVVWNVAFLDAVCCWRFERRRVATIRAWHAEHPDYRQEWKP